jgi:hypothetical protein
MRSSVAGAPERVVSRSSAPDAPCPRRVVRVTEPTSTDETTATAPTAERAPLTVAEMWRLSIAGAIVVLFVLGAIGVAFDVPGLRHALDLRRLFR